jgi:cytochrome c553
MNRTTYLHLVLTGLAIWGLTTLTFTGTSASTSSAMPVDVRGFRIMSGGAPAAADKAAVCGACHGADGNAIIPGYPSLAGQPADYLYLQLTSFANGWRINPIMQAQVAALKDQDLRALAIHYAALTRHASQGAATASDAAVHGLDVYLNGDSARGIPPCQGCHGANADGLANAHPTSANAGFELPRNFRTYPVLAGLSGAYVNAQLTAYKEGTRSDTTNARIMQAVAQNLDAGTVAALAAYLEKLPAPK